MILINRVLPDGTIKSIIHKGDDHGRDGEIMTDKELHEFGVALLTVYLYKQKGELISSNHKIGNEYPHLVAKNPKGELLYIWVKTEMEPKTPSIKSIENHEEVYKLSKQFNAIPVFAGINLSCVTKIDRSIPIYGGVFVANFLGFKSF